VERFIENRKLWALDEAVSACYNINCNMGGLIAACRKQKKKLPWEKPRDQYALSIVKMFSLEPEYSMEKIKKYLTIYPSYAKEFKGLNAVANDKASIKKYLVKLFHKPDDKVRFIASRVVEEYWLDYPEAPYVFGFCSKIKWLLPIEVSRKLSETKNLKDYAKCIYDYMKTV
jgi:hypothetical protein